MRPMRSLNTLHKNTNTNTQSPQEINNNCIEYKRRSEECRTTNVQTLKTQHRNRGAVCYLMFVHLLHGSLVSKYATPRTSKITFLLFIALHTSRCLWLIYTRNKRYLTTYRE
ncbi:hypothetical protein BKA57DRAFT_473120 [Linnemannia elongata]|nr:hypothetical protein BKA57DRAFT_473120 [Linnemannia elongata]